MAQAFPIELPYTPGLEVAGTVAAPGAGVEHLAVGAAALPVSGLTAQQALFEQGGLESGQRVLVNGAGGGVGGMGVQLAKRAGATAIATAGPRSAEAVRAHGADEIIDYTATPVSELPTEPVDLVLNLVAGAPDAVNALTALMADGGVGVSAPPMPPADDPARGVRWIQFGVRSDAAQLAEPAALVEKGELTLDIAARYPLADLAPCTPTSRPTSRPASCGARPGGGALTPGSARPCAGQGRPREGVCPGTPWRNGVPPSAAVSSRTGEPPGVLVTSGSTSLSPGDGWAPLSSSAMRARSTSSTPTRLPCAHSYSTTVRSCDSSSERIR
ncbi:zinc-binding dehydrogenase [Amycolatopsis acidiphila]|uniref:zinc-binding dehydrogenase n=1 Tax=Amycolatopsis acidiphila TaxID=715473 RepID=UPI001993F7C6|nr:zinc-binding dehydrogenase [Amycolatopsis acidiphila]GHG70663.1 hypothetical protein GCM10017788_32000 [Amycolatopsis acidiphila]